MIDQFISSYFDTSSLINNYKESFVSNKFLANGLLVCFDGDITYMYNIKAIIDEFNSVKHR